MRQLKVPCFHDAKAELCKLFAENKSDSANCKRKNPAIALKLKILKQFLLMKAVCEWKFNPPRGGCERRLDFHEHKLFLCFAGIMWESSRRVCNVFALCAATGLLRNARLRLSEENLSRSLRAQGLRRRRRVRLDGQNDGKYFRLHMF